MSDVDPVVHGLAREMVGEFYPDLADVVELELEAIVRGCRAGKRADELETELFSADAALPAGHYFGIGDAVQVGHALAALCGLVKTAIDVMEYRDKRGIQRTTDELRSALVGEGLNEDQAEQIAAKFARRIASQSE